MKQEEMTYLLQEPAEITFEQTKDLHEIVKKFPFFQAARAVRLKGLKNINSLHYNRELKLTAAHTADRAVLFDFITSEEFEQNHIASRIKEQEVTEAALPRPEEENKNSEKSFDLNTALKMKIQESKQVFDPELFGKKEGEQSDSEEVSEETTLEPGKPLTFDKDESHSFSEWLKLAAAKPIQREQEPTENDEIKSRKYELIEEFIAKSPRINPTKSSKKINWAEAHTAAPEALMTETLAKVYLEQKNYKKAIQAYKILILKNPEKSGFFADQIRAIEKLQENT